MSILESQVIVGGYYYANKQLRKIQSIGLDDKGRTRVKYLSKSALIPKRSFARAATNANPPLLATFLSACSACLDSAEIQRLRNEGILLNGE